MTAFKNADFAISHAIRQLKDYGAKVDTGHWQGVSTFGKPDLVTKELINMAIAFPIPYHEEAIRLIEPNMPWAEDHFQERVGREPTNPGEQYKNWPWWSPDKVEATAASFGVAETRREQELGIPSFKFTHTYQERFWPKYANSGIDPANDCFITKRDAAMQGIRYEYGDLDDVVGLLRREPYTRQATFPIFFPEDTGAVHGGRVPCTLHYHFLLRHNKLHLWYPIRSCDAVRHFRDDLYMACRLNHWVLGQLRTEPEEQGVYDFWRDVEPGTLFFTAYSFHVHMGDYHLL